MNVEDQVDNLLSKNGFAPKSKKKLWKRQYTIALGSFIVTVLLITMLVVPVFNKKSGFDILQSFLDSDEDKSIAVGDEEPEAYNYWYAPENSFGIQETKTVNWSYFKQLFLAHTDWMLEYKRYSYSEWTDGMDYLTIERTWNDTGFWKFNLILDVPVDIYSARFTFGIDLPALQYVERSGYEVWINYTANATENYSVMFNWSDIASIPNLVITKGVQGDMFWFRFRRDGIPAGHYEFDPTFGSGKQNTKSWNTFYRDIVRGNYAICPVDCTADNISVYLDPDIGTSSIKFQCALYNSTGVLIGTTNENTVTDYTEHWETFIFSSPPSLMASTVYYISGWADNSCYSWYTDTNENTHTYYADTYENGFPNPITWDGAADYNSSHYVSYTVGGPPANTAPVLSNPYVWDGTTQGINNTCIAIPPVSFNITLNDAEGDKMNLTIWENKSGWKVVNTSTNLANGTYSNNTNTSWVDAWDTLYWFSFNVTDGTDWTNQSHHFMTRSEPNVWLKTYANGSTNVPLSPTIEAQINTSCGYNSDVYFSENSTGSWIQRQANKTVTSNSSVNWTYTWANTGNTRFWYRINRSQAGVNMPNMSSNYIFTTAANETWQVVNDTINGSSFNTTHWDDFDSTINGSSYNITSDHIIDDTINGSSYNTTGFGVIDDTINGSSYNVTGWSIFDDNINGSSYNTTGFRIIDDTINGSSFNTTGNWQILDSTINGSSYNISIPINITITNEYPTNESVDIPLQPITYLTVEHQSGLTMNLTWYYGNSTANTTILYGTDANITNGTYDQHHFNSSNYTTTYYWRLWANDGTNYVNETFNFTTESDIVIIAGMDYTLGMIGVLGVLGILFVFIKRRKKRRE